MRLQIAATSLAQFISAPCFWSSCLGILICSGDHQWYPCFLTLRLCHREQQGLLTIPFTVWDSLESKGLHVQVLARYALWALKCIPRQCCSLRLLCSLAWSHTILTRTFSAGVHYQSIKSTSCILPMQRNTVL